MFTVCIICPGALLFEVSWDQHWIESEQTRNQEEGERGNQITHQDYREHNWTEWNSRQVSGLITLNIDWCSTVMVQQMKSKWHEILDRKGESKRV